MKLYIFLILFVIYIIYCRYDPLYPYFNQKRDPKQYRENLFFNPNYANNLLEKNGPNKPFKIVKRYNQSNIKNIISYCLYGSNPIYFKHIHYNIKQIKKKLPEWTIHIYLHDKVSMEFRNSLVETGVEIIIVTDPHVKPGNSSGAFWRFLPLTIENANVVVLDIDDNLDGFVFNLFYGSTINKIKKFFSSNNSILIDTVWCCPWPKEHIQAKWIFKKKELKMPFTADDIINFPLRNIFGADEYFLTIKLGEKLNKKIWKKNISSFYKLGHSFVRKRVESNL
jgi:hypothetical protein